MGDKLKLISKRLSEEPIKIPKNPFWVVFRRFGTDEFVAGVVNVLSTIIVALFTTSPIILSFAGPVLEK